ncbi:hypothetical protein PG995_013235 [Apiospora arundinis]
MMISMQRSLSSPVCIHSSPPVSPTTTTANRSPSPSPSPEARPNVSRRRRNRSRSPAREEPLRETVLTLPMRRSAEHDRRGSPHQSEGASAYKKPVVAQASSPSPEDQDKKSSFLQPSAPIRPALKTKPSPSYSFPQPLLPDVSLYTNPQLNLDGESTTLEELAHLVRLSKYQERKRANTRIRLQRSLVSTALSARLTRCGEITQRNLADSFRNEDKKAFANLYGAIHDVRNSCEDTRRFALLEPDMENLQSASLSTESLEDPNNTPGNGAPGISVTPFLNDISASAREAFLDFFTQLRTNPHYLATRLCSLSSNELKALTTFHQGLEPVESVLPFNNRPSGRGHGQPANRGLGSSPSAVERLLSFQRHDPLSALVHTCFANSAGPDSAEDKRRTEIWANTCARLISEAKNSASETILTSVLNVWASMRDWSGRSNLEWYLMKILEDGAFLLDRAEDSNGTRFNISEWTHKDNIAADEFYDRAIDELFEILDDEDATGIPEGVLELGNEILRRLDSRFVESTRRWLVSKWLFSSWLLSVVIHPESYGMMSEYHITEYGRQKILKQVAQRAQQLVLDMTWNNPHKPVSTPPKIKGHVESILGRFKPSRAQRSARLLPARSITSLRETAEVHPYLVISPADIITLVNALFPEQRRPQSAHSSSIRSGAPSISNFSTVSQPISIGTSRSNFDTASVLSMSASSVLSEATTSKEPLLEDQLGHGPQRHSPPLTDAASQKRLSNYEEDGYRLRLAMHEMVQILGPEVVSGACHPCAEKWAVVFISADGLGLSLQMTYDPDEEPEEENSSTTSETEDEDPEDRPELDKDYHQLRDSVLKLVEEFEIPQGLEDGGAKTTFSNRASGLKKYRSRNKILTPESSMASRNPYRRREAETRSSSSTFSSPTQPSNKGKDPMTPDESEVTPVLVTMLTAASSQSRVQSDFVSAHLYWKTLQQLNALASPSLRRNGFATLLNIFSRGPRDSIRRSASAIEEYDAWLVWLKQSQERHEGLIDSMMKRLRALRDKMWYVTDVHNSAPYEHTRNICSALKIMGVPRRWGAFQRTRAQLSRGPAANFLYRNESQMVDLLAAGEEQGGPNKLSDDQAEKTVKWLELMGIENFCRGEERIHRFCCEVDSCIGKLVGENIVDGPVLWSSELYTRDRKSLEGTKSSVREKESFWNGDDSASVISDGRYTSTSSRPNSIARDLRAMTTHNVSQLSVDSRYSLSRASIAISDVFDSQDYFGMASPVHAIDSNATFWSPFQSTMPSCASVTSRAQSPTTSITNLSSAFSYPPQRKYPSQESSGRPGTSASSNETIHLQRLSEEKQRFLEELRQTLTTLLLSEFGNYAFSNGSETDSWFGGLGQECIDRREAQGRRLSKLVAKKDRANKGTPKHRVLEKKKSFGNLRTANDHGSVDGTGEGSETATVLSNDSTATIETARSRGSTSTTKNETHDFPFSKAYKRLLRMFCVHPNPYVKLDALSKLEHLIVASLSTSGRRSKWGLRSSAMAHEDENIAGNSRILEQTIDNVKDRRSQAVQSPVLSPMQPRSGVKDDARSVISINPANTDAIANVLQSLFRDPSIRPKTLFRDLQFIAAFVPPSILDKTERGKAFWDTGLAALSLKQDVCRTMVEVADEIVKLQTQPRKTSVGSEDSLDSPRSALTYSLGDAARMWTITAKEGDPTAQRELALFHLSNPELVERTTLPLSKPREVFKQTVMEKYGARPGSSSRHFGDRARAGLGVAAPSMGPSDSGKDGDVRNDPALMCVAIHWMEAAEQGGDELARTFLGQNEMMGLG